MLGFVIGDLIYRTFPNLQEGALSKIKAHLVSASTLAAKGKELELGRYLRMGAGEARSGGSEKLSLLADAFEAIVAAIYLDGGLAAAEAFVRRVFTPDVSGIDVGDLSFHDYKTALQETAQSLGLPLPEYRVVDEYGPDHEKCLRRRGLLGRRFLRAREGVFQARGAAKVGEGSAPEARPPALGADSYPLSAVSQRMDRESG